MNDFYLYYDDNTGVIKAISPIPMTDYKDCDQTKIAHSVAIKFMTGDWDVNKWFVSTESTPEKGVLVETQFDLQPISKGELESIPREALNAQVASAVFVTVYSQDGLLEVSVPKQKNKINLKKIPATDMEFTITKRNDPSYVVDQVKVSVAELFEKGTVSVPFKGNLKDYSVHTVKLFRFYHLRVRRAKVSSSERVNRFNKLVPYQIVTKLKRDPYGINVIHNINNHTLTISLGSELDLMEDFGRVQMQLFLTKPHDPTIFVHSVTVDSSDLNKQRCVWLKLPPDLPEFGLAGFPYTTNLTLMRE